MNASNEPLLTDEKIAINSLQYLAFFSVLNIRLITKTSLSSPVVDVTPSLPPYSPSRASLTFPNTSTDDQKIPTLFVGLLVALLTGSERRKKSPLSPEGISRVPLYLIRFWSRGATQTESLQLSCAETPGRDGCDVKSGFRSGIPRSPSCSGESITGFVSKKAV